MPYECVCILITFCVFTADEGSRSASESYCFWIYKVLGIHFYSKRVFRKRCWQFMLHVDRLHPPSCTQPQPRHASASGNLLKSLWLYPCWMLRSLALTVSVSSPLTLHSPGACSQLYSFTAHNPHTSSLQPRAGKVRRPGQTQSEHVWNLYVERISYNLSKTFSISCQSVIFVVCFGKIFWLISWVFLLMVGCID